MVFFSKLFKSKPQAPAKTQKAQPKPSIPEQSLPRPSLEDTPDAQLLAFILQDNDADFALTVVAKLTDEADLLKVALEHKVAAVRMQAAQGITDSDNLQTLQQHSKGKDKAVWRLCKEHLSAAREVEKTQAARLERIDYLLSQVRYLTKLGYQPEFSGKLQLINQEWPELAEFASAEIQASMQAELSAAETILQQHSAEEAKIKAQQAAAASAQAEQQCCLDESTALLEQAAELSLEPLSAQITQLTQRWDENFKLHKPAAEIGKAFESALQQLLEIQSCLKHWQLVSSKVETWLSQKATDLQQTQSLLKQANGWLKALSWPVKASQPSWYQRTMNQYQALSELEQQFMHSQKAKAHSVQDLLTALSVALDAGESREASSLSRQVAQQLKHLSAQKAAPLQQEFRLLQGRLRELRDWAGFATTPKKEQLVASMEELLNLDLAAPLLADRIHALQEEWKALSGTGAGDDHDLWQRFSQAADAAFEPCKAYFAEQAKLRDGLVELRHKLINELDAYEQGMDWSVADWKAVQKTLDTARETFRTYGPVERAVHKQTQERFNAVCDRIFSHLKVEYERNLELKRGIVSQAEALVNSENLQGIVDSVKTLQANWQTVGLTPRAADQKLWQQFRKHCDAVFERLNSQREERKEEISHSIQTAQELVNAACNAPAEQKKQLLHEANQHIHSVSLPKSVFQAVLKQLQEAQNSIHKHEQKAKQAGLIARLQALNADTDAWAQACALPLPANFEQALFEQARQGQLSSADSAQDLCILLELVNDQESPVADQGRRMELQVQRLADGLGKGLTQADEVRAIIERWLAVKADESLVKRFLQAL